MIPRKRDGIINPGKYRYPVTIKGRPTNRDASGALIGTGTTVASVYADKEDWTGSETRDDGKETSVVVTKYYIRYRTDVLSKMQLFDGALEYDIENVMDFDGTKRELTLVCRRVS